MRNYYHAGCGSDPTAMFWSSHTRRTRERAEAEARTMAARFGGRPVVEYWSREHGLRPGDADAVAGADYID